MNGSVGGEGEEGEEGGPYSTFFPYFISQSPDFIRRQTDFRLTQEQKILIFPEILLGLL